MENSFRHRLRSRGLIDFNQGRALAIGGNDSNAVRSCSTAIDRLGGATQGLGYTDEVRGAEMSTPTGSMSRLTLYFLISS